MYNIKVTNPKHPLFGKTANGYICYHDLYHTGDGPDLFSLEYENKKYRALSTDIDLDDYNRQELDAAIEKCGANIGDTVEIISSNGGSFASGFQNSGYHVVTKIDRCGNVEVDGGTNNGGAYLSLPKLKKVSLESKED